MCFYSFEKSEIKGEHEGKYEDKAKCYIKTKCPAHLDLDELENAYFWLI